MMKPATDLNGTKFGLPRVSVIITNYNYEKFLPEAISSVFGQTYPDVECVVVDDCSTDGSLRALAEAEQSYPTLKIVRRQTNGGQSAAFRDGFEASSGEYVVFLDADDYLLPTCVATHVFVHLSLRTPVGLSSVDMIQSWGDRVVTGGFFWPSEYVRSGRSPRNFFRRIDESAPFLWTIETLEGDVEKLVHLIEPDLGAEFHHWRWAATSGNCFRRDAAALFLGSDHLTAQRHGADNYLVRAVNMLTGSVIIDRPLVVYRIHGQNWFTRHPELYRLRSCDADRLFDENLVAWRMIVDHIFSQIAFFASKLPSDTQFARLIENLDRAFAVAPSDVAGCGSYVAGKVARNAAPLLRSLGRECFCDLLIRLRIDSATLVGLDRNSTDEIAVAVARLRKNSHPVWVEMLPLRSRRRVAEGLCTIGRLIGSEAMQRLGTRLWSYLESGASTLQDS
jgi:glycosyltransferase involved in cell wall biosynthesis